MSKSKPVSYLYCGWLHQADRPSEGGPLELVYTLEDVHASVFQMIDHGIETLRVNEVHNREKAKRVAKEELVFPIIVGPPFTSAEPVAVSPPIWTN